MDHLPQIQSQSTGQLAQSLHTVICPCIDELIDRVNALEAEVKTLKAPKTTKKATSKK